jgi:hypothetical protein
LVIQPERTPLKVRVLFVLLVLAHCLLLIPFSSYLAERPMEIKLGYIPNPQVLKVTVADQGLLVAQAAVVRVLFYYDTCDRREA